MQESDVALIARVAQHDHEALRHLYERYYDALYTYLWHRLRGDAMLIDEALQDVFVAVWHHANSYRGEAQVKTWLFRIAHGTAFHAWRAQSRHQELSALSSDTRSFSDPQHATPEDEIVSRLHLHDALHQLSEKHQTVLLLVFDQGFSL
ncbi:MAG TPA: RNA polymerase sigma factor, partial [Ktedonobacterales bacterium]|nr:RNA polymerase sigma factor [Ktedonobacterales bacterium]